MCDIHYSQSEEAFLLSCVHEVIKVWSSKGQATLNLSVKDGHAAVHLGFQLGDPEQAHAPNQQPAQPQFPKFKSPAKKQKDRARAAEHQRKLQHHAITAAPAINALRSSSLVHPTKPPPTLPLSTSKAAPALFLPSSTAATAVALPTTKAAPACSVLSTFTAAPASPLPTSKAAPASLLSTSSADPAFPLSKTNFLPPAYPLPITAASASTPTTTAASSSPATTPTPLTTTAVSASQTCDLPTVKSE